MSVASSRKKSRPDPLKPEAEAKCRDGLEQALQDAAAILRPMPASSGLEGPGLEGLMRTFHIIKGYAQFLSMDSVEKAAHALESRVQGLLSESRRTLSGTELSAVLREGLRDLTRRVAETRPASVRPPAELKLLPGADPSAFQNFRVIFWRLSNAAQRLAIQHHRELEFEFSGESTALAAERAEPLFNALLHAIRNCVAHASSPDRAVRISVRAWREGRELRVECVDTGTGIDPKRVEEQARRLGVTPDVELARLGSEGILQLLFLPGFSLSSEVNQLAGRGYGLNLVREIVVEKLGGMARIESSPGQGVRLVFRFAD
jgi:chemotaxis protein histidine kinase CheA